MPAVQPVPDEPAEVLEESCCDPVTSLVKRAWRLICPRKKTVNISEYDPEYEVVCLGFAPVAWARSEGWAEQPLLDLCENYTSGDDSDLEDMKLVVLQAGLKTKTDRGGVAEYWVYRISHVEAPTRYPKVLCWAYRHDSCRLGQQEIRLHAVKCVGVETARNIAAVIKSNVARARAEYKQFRIKRQNARMTLFNSIYENPSIPQRKILLSVGANNYRPPLKMKTKSEHPLTTIEEHEETCDFEMIPLKRAKSRWLSIE